MLQYIRLAPVLAAILLLACPVQAHHSFAMFDKERLTKLGGVISKVEWRNPHVFFFVDAVDEKGETATYALESDSPNVLMRTGWKRSTLKVGDEVTLDYYPLRDGRPGGLLNAVILPNGERLGG